MELVDEINYIKYTAPDVFLCHNDIVQVIAEPGVFFLRNLPARGKHYQGMRLECAVVCRMAMGIGVLVEAASFVEAPARLCHIINYRVYLKDNNVWRGLNKRIEKTTAITLSPQGGTDGKVLHIAILLKHPAGDETHEDTGIGERKKTIVAVGERRLLLRRRAQRKHWKTNVVQTFKLARQTVARRIYYMRLQKL